MRKVEFSDGEMYHLYNRGVDKRTVFTSKTEYRRFTSYLYLLNTVESIRPADIFDQYELHEILSLERGAPLVAVGAYCLMPNHIHLLVTPLAKNGVSRYMQRVQTAYTMYFNTKHKRSGSLFQGTFKAEHADSDVYANYLYSYIHLNPAKLVDPLWKESGPKDFAKLREFVRAYPHSSLTEYLSGTHTITNPTKFPEYLSEKKDVSDHIDFWLKYHESATAP